MDGMQVRSTGRRFEVVVLVAFFAICSLSGTIWGLIVRAPSAQDPTIESIAVFPIAWDVATPTVLRQPGVASPTTTVLARNSTDEGLINYQFRTSSPPDKIVAHYRQILKERYDFRIYRQQDVGPGMQVLTFLRPTTFHVLEDNRGGFDKELITVTISPQDTGFSLVKVAYQLIMFK